MAKSWEDRKRDHPELYDLTSGVKFDRRMRLWEFLSITIATAVLGCMLVWAVFRILPTEPRQYSSWIDPIEALFPEKTVAADGASSPDLRPAEPPVPDPRPVNVAPGDVRPAQVMPPRSRRNNASLESVAAKPKVAPERVLLALALFGGALGGCIHALTSITYHRANCTLTVKWSLWYLCRPLIGGALGLVFVVVIRGGFMGIPINEGTASGARDADTSRSTPPYTPVPLPPGAPNAAAAAAAKESAAAAQDVAVLFNPYAALGIALLVGMFSAQASAKLQKVAQAFFDPESEKPPPASPRNPDPGPGPKPGTTPGEVIGLKTLPGVAEKRGDKVPEKGGEDVFTIKGVVMHGDDSDKA